MKISIALSLLASASLAAQAHAESSDVEVVELSSDDSAEAVAEEDVAYEDGYLRLVDLEARDALAVGDIARAHRLYRKIVELRPNDARALREYGRTASALGDLHVAVDALARCNRLRDGAPDPELHFLRGEALIALHEREEGMKELAQAESELAVAPPSRQTKLWQARIHALRHESDRAEEMYVRLRGDDPETDEYRQASLLLAEAYLMDKRLADAKRILVAYNERYDDARARDMLAWVLELRGDQDEEVDLRRSLSGRWDGAQAPALVGYARSLERSQNYNAALDRYQSAQRRGNKDVSRSIERLSYQVAPEVMGLASVLEDPTGVTSSVGAGGVVHATDTLRLSARGFRDAISPAALPGMSTAPPDAELFHADAGFMLGIGGWEVGALATAWRDPEQIDHLGGAALMHSDPSRSLRAYGRVGFNEAWSESTATLQAAASTNSAELQLYQNLFSPRWVMTGSARARELTVPPLDYAQGRSAREFFGSVGVDHALWVGDMTLKGHAMQDSLLRPASAGELLMLSYRHNEVSIDGNLGARVGLVPRSRVDEVSATGRYILDPWGYIAIGGTGGLGYDSQRDARLWRVGAEVMLAITGHARLTLRSDMARETTALFTGRRSMTQAGLHVDF